MTKEDLIQLKKEVDAISKKLARYIEALDENVPAILKKDLIEFIILSGKIPDTICARLVHTVSLCVFGRQVEREQTITIGEFIKNYSMRDLLKCRNAGKKTVLALQNAFKEVGVEWK